jgi:membrane-associated protein
MHFDLISFIKAAGYVGVFGFIFAESGLFIGFFLPGDSLLFTAGFLASQGFLDIWVLAIGTFVAAVAGVSVGYAFGKKVGPALFKREDSLIFHKQNLETAREFYEKHGGKAIVLARFVPIVRTFAPILAGVGRMEYGKFLVYNVIGAFLWGLCLPFIGYFLGNTIPNVDKYLLPIIALIILASILPGIIHLIKDKSSRDKILSLFRKGSV